MTKISILTVTYGNRFHFLKQVLERVAEEKPFEIIVVDNNSENKEEIESFIKNSVYKNFKYIRFEENKGSAGGFGAGMEYFVNTEGDYLLLLDDDNLIEKNFIEKFLNYLNIFEKKDEVVLVANRLLNDKNMWLDDVSMDKLSLFSAFNFILKKIFKYFKNQIREEGFLPIRKALGFGYGGGIIPKKIIKEIGFPKYKYFVYADDLEWTHRIYKKNYPIYNVYNIKIEDLDLHNHPKDRTNFLTDKNIAEFRLVRSWYNTHFFYSSDLKKNSFSLYFNLYTYAFIIFLSLVIKRKISKLALSRISLFIKFSKRGVKDGKNEKYNFNSV